MNGIRTRRARARRRKIIAVAAAGAVLLTGATVTSLAAWLDEEWVTAGVDGVSGVTASEFEIEQLVAGVGEDWENHETLGTSSVVSFDDVAAQLSPGASAVGWVSLRAAADSLGGDVVLQSASPTFSGPLAAALRYSAWLHDTAATCDEVDFATGTLLVDDEAVNVGSGSTTFTLDAGTGGAAGEDDTVCFRITLPLGASDTLQGETATVGWYFESTSG